MVEINELVYIVEKIRNCTKSGILYLFIYLLLLFYKNTNIYDFFFFFFLMNTILDDEIDLVSKLSNIQRNKVNFVALGLVRKYMIAHEDIFRILIILFVCYCKLLFPSQICPNQK